MKALIDTAISHARTVVLVLLMVLTAGTVSFLTIPKEAEPDIDLPYVYVSMNHEGISPEDAERLLVRPMETELRSIEGVKEMTAMATEGHASVFLEFSAGFDADKAEDDVRQKVDVAKADLPSETDEPTVTQISISQEPIILVTVYGDVDLRTLDKVATKLAEDIEGIQGILEVDVAGDREELLEVIVDPLALESYNISQTELIQSVDMNNRLVAAGALDSGAGRFAVKVPGLFENAQDVMEMPVKVSGDSVVRISDVAVVRRTFKDAESYARLNNRPAIVLEVKKRVGANIIDTINAIKVLTEASKPFWPAGIEVILTQDKSKNINTMLTDLGNNVTSAVLLVMIVVMAALGLRSSFLVGLAIPGAFLMGILFLNVSGLTINIVVLFSLILAVGMLVDGAIVVTEYADRKMMEGMHRNQAYGLAAHRMSWPIIASTATTLAAFAPLLFWPDITGQFMRYMPLTLITTLTGSLIMALIFIPTLGSLIPSFRKSGKNAATLKALSAAEAGDIRQLSGFTGLYARMLSGLVAQAWRPFALMVVVVGGFIGTMMYYGQNNNGVEFFPNVEPETANVIIHARGNLSVDEKDALVRDVEEMVLSMDGLDAVYTRVGAFSRGADVSEDTIASISLEFADWQTRRPTSEILDDIDAAGKQFSGIQVETSFPNAGPPVGKDVQIELRSDFPELLEPALLRIRNYMEQQPELIALEDSRALPGIEWKLDVDRAQASRFGTNVTTVGQMVQLITGGIKIGTYRPDDSDGEIDIRLRYPESQRDVDNIDQLRVLTNSGQVPISNFSTRVAEPKTGTINRVDQRRVLEIKANTDGVQPTEMVTRIKEWMETQTFDSRIDIVFRGADEKQNESGAFLQMAFMIALGVMFIILVTQFNNIYFAVLILTAVILSLIGVLWGMIFTGQTFSIVMTGVGIISLAGIVVNNNIVLIDTYQYLVRQGMEPLEAVVRTGAQRLRPVALTTITTVIGLLPMVLQINIDFLTREIAVGAPSTQWWVQLATAVAFGLSFATVLTLVFTPAMLAVEVYVRKGFKALFSVFTPKSAEPAAAE